MRAQPQPSVLLSVSHLAFSPVDDFPFREAQLDYPYTGGRI